jgi:uncharacterized membrane-anchored protein YhcB (DUF1043 family)
MKQAGWLLVGVVLGFVVALLALDYAYRNHRKMDRDLQVSQYAIGKQLQTCQTQLFWKPRKTKK